MKLKITLTGLVIVIVVAVFIIVHHSTIPPSYPIDPDSLFIIKDKGKYGFINGKGDVVIPCIYELAEPFSEGLSAVKYKEKMGYINTDGEFHIEPRYLSISSFSGGLAFVSMSENGCSIIDKTGNVVSHSKRNYDYISGFTADGLSVVKVGEVWGYIDRNFDLVIKRKFIEYAGDFLEGLALVFEKKGVNCYYIDKTGEKVIEGDFFFGESFNNGVALVVYEKENKIKFGFIDIKGNNILGLYDTVTLFSEGLAMVTDDGKSFCINEKGATVFELEGEYDYFGLYNCNRVIVKNKDCKISFLDRAGKEVIAAKYDMAAPFKNGLTWVEDKVNKKMGYIDTDGRWFWCIKYSAENSIYARSTPSVVWYFED